MTQKEMFTAIVNGEINDEVIAKAQACLDSIDASNAKRAAKNEEKSKENEALANKIIEMLSDAPLTASDIADALEVTPQKVSSVLRTKAAGRFAKVDVKVAKDGKNHKVVGYVVA